MATRRLLNHLWIGQAMVEGVSLGLGQRPPGHLLAWFEPSGGLRPGMPIVLLAEPKGWNPVSKVVVHHHESGWLFYPFIIKSYRVSHLTKSNAGQ